MAPPAAERAARGPSRGTDPRWKNTQNLPKLRGLSSGSPQLDQGSGWERLQENCPFSSHERLLRVNAPSPPTPKLNTEAQRTQRQVPRAKTDHASASVPRVPGAPHTECLRADKEQDCPLSLPELPDVFGQAPSFSTKRCPKTTRTTEGLEHPPQCRANQRIRRVEQRHENKNHLHTRSLTFNRDTRTSRRPPTCSEQPGPSTSEEKRQERRTRKDQWVDSDANQSHRRPGPKD